VGLRWWLRFWGDLERGGRRCIEELAVAGFFGGASRHFGLISFSAKTEDAWKLIAGKEGAYRE
jgi:hypothetical protein